MQKKALNFAKFGGFDDVFPKLSFNDGFLALPGHANAHEEEC
jgi:hypothetical protein